LEKLNYDDRLRQEFWKPSCGGVAGVNRLVTELNSSKRSCTATYLRNAMSEFFTLTKLKEQGIAPGIVMVATGPVERVAKLLEEVRLNGTKLEF
jgi:hypothetical protein